MGHQHILGYLAPYHGKGMFQKSFTETFSETLTWAFTDQIKMNAIYAPNSETQLNLRRLLLTDKCNEHMKRKMQLRLQ